MSDYKESEMDDLLREKEDDSWIDDKVDDLILEKKEEWGNDEYK